MNIFSTAKKTMTRKRYRVKVRDINEYVIDVYAASDFQARIDAMRDFDKKPQERAERLKIIKKSNYVDSNQGGFDSFGRKMESETKLVRP